MHNPKLAQEYLLKIAIATIASPLKGVPSGELYAAYMSDDHNLDRHMFILGMLERAKLIKVENHLCTCIHEAILAETSKIYNEVKGE
jgi:hypothetical protein